MRFMVIVKADQKSEAGVLPDKKLFAEMGKFNEELAKAGVLLAAEGLHPSSKGARVKFSGAKRTVVDGPFAESKELVGGFCMMQMGSIDQVSEWANRYARIIGGTCEIDVRPVAEPNANAPSRGAR